MGKPAPPGMDHDRAKENWSRGNNKTPGCSCPPWRYNPRYPRPTNPDCKIHGPGQGPFLCPETEQQ